MLDEKSAEVKSLSPRSNFLSPDGQVTGIAPKSQRQRRMLSVQEDEEKVRQLQHR